MMYRTITLILFMLGFTLIGKTQTIKIADTAKQNELHLNLLSSLTYGFLELSYERILNEDSSIGLSGFVPVVKHKTYAYGVIPYYRQFFGNKIASGIFVEGNLGVFSRKDNIKLVYDDYGGYSSLLTNGLNFGYGVAVGAKLVSKRNFLVNIYGGVNRLINTNGDDVFPRAGITIGKRF